MTGAQGQRRDPSLSPGSPGVPESPNQSHHAQQHPPAPLSPSHRSPTTLEGPAIASPLLHPRHHHRRHGLQRLSSGSSGSDAADAAGTSVLSLAPAPSTNSDLQMTHRKGRGNDDGASSLSDAKMWFDTANRNPAIPFDPSPMDEISSGIRPGLQSVSSPRNPPYPVASPGGQFYSPDLIHSATRSSSADEFRSVIDDLTIENKRLKEELKRYRQSASCDLLDKEKLFEIKVHGLPRRKKQELEATLRNFAANLGDSASSQSTSQRKREKSASSSKAKAEQLAHSSRGASSKHASNSSSRSRPVDSAYASMSVGANSGGNGLSRPSFGGPQVRTSEQKVESYLQDIPEGLYPNYGFGALSEKEKKKLIVRRLEQLFTGKIGGRHARRNRAMLPPPIASQAPGTAAAGDKASIVGIVRNNTTLLAASAPSAASAAGANTSSASKINIAPAPVQAVSVLAGASANPSVPSSEPSREARIQAQAKSHMKGESRDNLSSNSNGDEAGNGNGNGTGTGNGSRSTGGNGSGNGGNGNGKLSTDVTAPEQRPTRPRDLDPDRIQNPTENMEYIRHLGLTPPEIGSQSESTVMDMSPDSDGWVYLNLLANLAQVHIFNVAPDFIRKAIVEKSTKFQLSPDGQKIRWRGGLDGTIFSSDGSGNDNSQQSHSTDEGDDNNESNKRKRAKAPGDRSASGTASGSKKASKFGPQASGASSSFHYKPLFVRRNPSPLSSGELGSQSSDEREESRGITANLSNSNENSRSSGLSPSGSSPHSKRRHSDGVLVYYNGAPFCTDLAGDKDSPTTVSAASMSPLAETMDEEQSSIGPAQPRFPLHRTDSGSSMTFRPLTDLATLSDDKLVVPGLDSPPELSDDTSMSDLDVLSDEEDDPIWPDYGTKKTSEPEDPPEPFLEASGISRVFPEDHFSIMVTTERQVQTYRIDNSHDDNSHDEEHQQGGKNSAGAFSMSSLLKRLATLRTPFTPFSNAVPRDKEQYATVVTIKYLKVEVRPRKPVPLPPPAMFYSPFSSSSESDLDDNSVASADEDDEDESMLASSSEEMISRLANPHQSDNNPSPISQEVLMSGDVSDVEAGTMEVDSRDDDDF